jgi:hypothetical protein
MTDTLLQDISDSVISDVGGQLFLNILGGATTGLMAGSKARHSGARFCPGAVASAEQRQADHQRHDCARRQLEQGLTEIADLLKDSQRQQISRRAEFEKRNRVEPYPSEVDVWDTIRALFID